MRWLLGSLFIAIILFLGVIFTPVGNTLLKPYVEATINENIPIKAELTTFQLGWSDLHIVLTVGATDRIELQGRYSLLRQHLQMNYTVDTEDVSVFNTLISQPLQGPVHTNGTIVAEMPDMVVQGSAILRESHLDYKINLTEFEPRSVVAKGDLKLQEILHLLVQPSFAEGDIALHANIQELDLDALEHSKGDLIVAIKEGYINTATVQQQYNISLKETPFVVDLNAKLHEVNATLLMDAVIAKNSKISCNTTLDVEALSVKGTYDIAVKDLAPFSVLAGIPLQGPLFSKGTVKGNKKQTTVEGDVGIVATQMQYSLFLEKFKARRLKLNGDAALHEVLYLIAQPIYVRADMNLLVAMNNLDQEALTGVVKTTVNSGTLNSVLLQRDFNLTLPLTTFKAEATTQIKEAVAISAIELISTIASLQTQQSVVNLHQGTLRSDYRVIVDDLSQLQFLTKRPLRGAVTLEGEVGYADANLEITAHSGLLGGQMDATMLNNKLSIVTKNFQTTALSEMLMMPKVFASTMNATLNYDTLSQKGTLRATLLQGRILPSEMSMLLHQLAHFDITKEVYETTEINSSIDHMQVISDVYMTSHLSNIKATNTLLDLQNNRVDARLDLMLQDYPVPLRIQGDMDAPHIGIDVNTMFQDEGKAKLKEVIDTKLGERLSPEAKELLKGLFN